jgi:hypothetical protein
MTLEDRCARRGDLGHSHRRPVERPDAPPLGTATAAADASRACPHLPRDSSQSAHQYRQSPARQSDSDQVSNRPKNGKGGHRFEPRDASGRAVPIMRRMTASRRG